MLIVAPTVTFETPVLLNGQGTVMLGENVQVGYVLSGFGEILLQARYPDSIITVGKGTVLSNGVQIFCIQRVSIGQDCRIGKCVILDADFHGIQPDQRDGGTRVKPVTIGNNVFIGVNVTILKGVTIGDNSVIGAGSVVTKDLPADTIYPTGKSVYET